MEIDVTLDGGAYLTLSGVVLSRAILHAWGPYRCEHVRVRGRVLQTHMAPNGAFRGFGAPEGSEMSAILIRSLNHNKKETPNA